MGMMLVRRRAQEPKATKAEVKKECREAPANKKTEAVKKTSKKKG